MNEEFIKVLLVEDNPGDARLVEIALSEPGPVEFKLERVGLLSAALRRLEKEEFNIMLLDLSLPDSQGMDTVTAVREQHQEVPIVVLTGLDDESKALGALRTGAQDYLVKGTATGETLRRTIRYAIERRKILADLNNVRGSDITSSEALNIVRNNLLNLVDAETSPFCSTDNGNEMLRNRMPRFMDDISEIYSEHLAQYVNGKKSGGEKVNIETLVERLADKKLGAQDVLEIHLNAMERLCSNGNSDLNKMLALKGPFAVLEVMGRLVNLLRSQNVPSY